MQRRTVLEILTAAGGALVAAIVGIPAIISAVSPGWRVRRPENWQPLGRFVEFPDGETSEAIVEVPRDDTARSLRDKLVYVRRDAGETIVFARSCTDLSCPVVWDRGSQCFFCPCHGGIFSREGDPMAGPPPQPLFRYANRVRDGQLEIDLNSVPPMV